MHASGSRLITIRPLAKAAVSSASVRLPPALERQQRERRRLAEASQDAQDDSPLSSSRRAGSQQLTKEQRKLTSDTAGKLLLARDRAVRAAAHDLERQHHHAVPDNDADGGTSPAARQESITKAAIAAAWPSNLRVEPEIHRRDLYWKVPTEQREQLRKLLKER